MKKRFIALLTCIALILSAACFSFDTEAASAKSILKKAYKQMKKYDTVAYCYIDTYKENGQKKSDAPGISISDNSISYTIDNTSEMWHLKSRVFTKYTYNDSWSLEKNENDNKTPDHYYGKKLFQYMLNNLNNPKIKKSTKKSYTIVGTSPIKDNMFSKVEYTINKKTYQVTGIVFYYNDFSTSYDSKVTNYKWTITNMCYGHGKLKAPKLLK
jgi:hypothetical protein